MVVHGFVCEVFQEYQVYFYDLFPKNVSKSNNNQELNRGVLSVVEIMLAFATEFL
jgi:hypothetical protein|tara:strand:+ start:863 stop:1027 length:165 start_codon:yes stop_codon:yes gene_type:complete